MKNVFKKLEELKGKSSTKEKIELLKSFLNDSLFKKVVQYALDGRKHYNIKVFEPIVKYNGADIDTIFETLDKLSNKLGASQDSKQYLANCCEDEKTWEVVNRIVTKNLKCGVSAKLVNKANPETIMLVPYQRCSTLTKKKNIKYPAIWQIKMNGLFANILLGEKSFLSRKGNQFYWASSVLTSSLHKLSNEYEGYVLLGEGLVFKGKTFEYMNRQEGNGILNKALKKTITKGESERVCFTIWDCVPLSCFKSEMKCNVPYTERFEMATEIVNKLDSKHFRMIKSVEVSSFDEALKITDKYIKKGEEGGVLKNKDTLWSNTTSTSMIKIKPEYVCDLEVIRWEYGDSEGKFANGLGTIVCASSDKKLTVGIGTGLKEKYRLQNTKIYDDLIGEIVEVVFGEIIQEQKGGTYSLYLPRFDTTDKNPDAFIRTDKTKADDLKTIKDIVNGTISHKKRKK